MRPEDSALCFVKCIDEYPERSQKWKTTTKTQILLSFISPHQEISNTTVSNWIKTTLKLQLEGHLTRSEANLVGLLVNDILYRGSWSNKSTWQRFYHKEYIPSVKIFQAKGFSSE